MKLKKILISAICTGVIFAITSCSPGEKISVSGEEKNNNISEEKETRVTVDSIIDKIEPIWLALFLVVKTNACFLSFFANSILFIYSIICQYI